MAKGKITKAFSGMGNYISSPRIYADITGNLNASLLLNQIVYWSDKTKRADGFFYKSYKDWQKEIALSEYQVRKASKQLQEMNLIEVKLIKANNAPTLHYKPILENIETAIVKFVDNQETKESDTEETKESDTEVSQESHSEETKESIYTENTTDITTKNTTYRDLDFSFVDDELKEAVKEFTEFRKNIKSPMTQKALVLLVNKLNKEGSNNEERIEMMNESIMNNWKSVYPLKKKSGWNQKKNDIDVDYGMDSLERWEQKHGKLFKG